MIEIQVTQTVRLACDHCGQPATGGWHAKVHEARRAAADAGFRVSSWVEGACPRESWYCRPCWAQALETEAVVKDPSALPPAPDITTGGGAPSAFFGGVRCTWPEPPAVSLDALTAELVLTLDTPGIYAPGWAQQYVEEFVARVADVGRQAGGSTPAEQSVSELPANAAAVRKVLGESEVVPPPAAPVTFREFL